MGSEPTCTRLAHGRDERSVVPEREAKSIGSENTLDADIAGEDAIRPWLLRAADTVARRLRGEGLVAHGIRVKLRTADFRLHTRQTTLARATHATRPIAEAAESLLREFDLTLPVRLVGCAAFELRKGDDTGGDGTGRHQLDLFEAPRSNHDERLDRTLDVVHERFGAGAMDPRPTHRSELERRMLSSSEAAPPTDETCTAPLPGASLPGATDPSQPRTSALETTFENSAQQGRAMRAAPLVQIDAAQDIQARRVVARDDSREPTADVPSPPNPGTRTRTTP